MLERGPAYDPSAKKIETQANRQDVLFQALVQFTEQGILPVSGNSMFENVSYVDRGASCFVLDDRVLAYVASHAKQLHKRRGGLKGEYQRKKFDHFVRLTQPDTIDRLKAAQEQARWCLMIPPRVFETLDRFDVSFPTNHPDAFLYVTQFMDDFFEYASAKFPEGSKLTFEDLTTGAGWESAHVEILRKHGVTDIEFFLLYQHFWKHFLKKEKHERSDFRLSRSLMDGVASSLDLFTPRLIEEMLGLEPNTLTPTDVRTALLDACPSALIREMLGTMGFGGVVAVIEKRRKYHTCPQTETRLKSELESRQATVAEFNFPDGSKSTLAFKYGEVTVGVCVESTSPTFVPMMSYLPVGETVGWAMDLEPGTRTIVRLRPDEKNTYVFAKNRPMNVSGDDWERIKRLCSTLA